MKDKHIIAIGGGGFGRSIGNLKIESYIINLTKSNKPNICFLPTATGDNDSYKVNFYSVFSSLGCNPTHIDFFKRTINIRDHLCKQDIIFVGGGNTKSMLAIWRDWGVDLLLKDQYEKGTILAGVSAGAVCWFSKAITDSWADDLKIIDGLGLIEGTCCPHYDEEASRIPFVEKALKNREIDSCIAIEGNCALHFKNGNAYSSLSFGGNKNSFYVSIKDGNLISSAHKSVEL